MTDARAFLKRNLPVLLTLAIVVAVGVVIFNAVIGSGRGKGKVQAIAGDKITLDFVDARVEFTCDNIPEWIQVGQWVEAEWDALGGNLTILNVSGTPPPSSFVGGWNLLALLGTIVTFTLIWRVVRWGSKA